MRFVQVYNSLALCGGAESAMFVLFVALPTSKPAVRTIH